MSRREFFTTAHKPAPPAYFGGWRMRLYNCFSWGWEPLNYLSWTVGCFVLVFKKLFFDFFFFGGSGERCRIYVQSVNTFCQLFLPHSAESDPLSSFHSHHPGPCHLSPGLWQLSDWSLCLHPHLRQYFKCSVQRDRFQTWVASDQFPARDPVMALLPAGVKARCPPSGCLLRSARSSSVPSFHHSSEAVPAPARCVPSGLRFPSPRALSSQTSAGLTPPLRSFFCSERPSLYHFLSFFSCLKKKKESFTHIVHLFLDSYK